MDFRVESAENDMLSIAHAYLHEINHVKTTIKNTNTRIDFMSKRLIHIEEAFQIPYKRQEVTSKA